MTANRNTKKLEDYLENTASQLSRESFVKTFVAYLAAHTDKLFVTNEQKEIFFEIANDYMAWRSGMQALPKKFFWQDYDSCQKLTAVTKTKLADLQTFFSTKRDNSRPTTALLASKILEELAVLQNKLDDIFFDQETTITGRRRLLAAASRKTLERELTIDLERFIAVEFPSVTAEERNILIGATFAGTGRGCK